MKIKQIHVDDVLGVVLKRWDLTSKCQLYDGEASGPTDPVILNCHRSTQKIYFKVGRDLDTLVQIA
jgi:hypothetical protein